jgi:hypothetical protein
VSWRADVVRQLDKLCVRDNPFNFPSVKDRKKDGDHHHADIEMLNRALESMPCVDFGPHGARYALASYGESELGFAKSEAKLILDHLEGTDPKDVTGNFYSSDPAIKRKWEMLLLWTEWLDKQAELAIAADPLLLDRNHLREAIFRKKHGDEKLAKSIEFRESRGWPLWPDDQQEAAE